MTADKTKTVKKTAKKVEKGTLKKASRVTKAPKIEKSSKVNLLSLSQKVDALQDISLPKMRDNIISAVLNVFEQISFIEEAEDIKNFVNTKINGIKCALGELPTGLDDYSYTLDDVESDIAKLRLALEKFANESKNDEILNIVQKVSQIEVVLESLQNFVGQMQINELKLNVEKISDNVLSVSSRMNSMLLNWDELQKNIKSLEDCIDEAKSNRLKDSEVTEQIVRKTDDIADAVEKISKQETSTRQALAYLGEWIDGAGSEFSKLTDIKNTLDFINNKCPDSLKLVTYIAERFADFEDKFANLETKLNKITSSIEKIDNVENYLAKLSSSVEKLTAYVD